MTTLDTIVLLFGVLVSGLVGTGFLMLFYGHAFAAQSMRESSELDSGAPGLEKPWGKARG